MSRKQKKKRLKSGGRKEKHRQTARAQQARHSAASPSVAPRGFDFGVPVTGLLVGAMEFPAHLHEAKAIAVAFGLEYSAEIQATLPSLSLVVRNPAPAAKAFSEFQRWGSDKDGDAVELALVLEVDGSYTFALGREMQRFTDQLTNYDRAFAHMPMTPVWMLPIPTSGEHLRQFSDWRRGPVRPFLLTVSSLPAGGDPSRRMPSALRPIPGIKSILKFECTIVQPGHASEKPTGQVAVLSARRRAGQAAAPASDPKLDPSQVRIHRQRILSTFFPVTLERLHLFGLRNEVSREVKQQGIAPWQLQQAICNLVLSRSLSHGAFHYNAATLSDDLPRTIAEALRSYVEEPSGEHFAIQAFTADQILTQIELDSRFLLTAFGQSSLPGSLPELQDALIQLGSIP